MVAKMKRTSKKEEKKGKVRIGNLKTTRELSADDEKKVKGGKSTPQDFNFVHKVDKSSPVLL